jgi:A/G-specific adenine glycosylase
VPRGLRPALLAWFDRVRRDLPWRSTRDPYAIWVSEIMLQQTRAAFVAPYWRRFLDRFPDPAALAAAAEDDVLAAWSGLGYYRRARDLHAAARVVADRHGGRVPDDPERLRELPGVGRYTAGAIASIAFGREVAVVDGNVRRVLARVFAPVSGDGRAWEIAAALVRGPRPGDLNQALMELGAIACTPRSPSCRDCPAARWCRAFASGDPEREPAPVERRATIDVRVAVALVRRGGHVLVERPAPASPLRGRWDVPAIEVPAASAAGDVLAAALAERFGIEAAFLGDAAANVSHAILHRRLRLEIYSGSLRRGRVRGRADLRWLDPAALDRVPVSGATRKVLRALDR